MSYDQFLAFLRSEHVQFTVHKEERPGLRYVTLDPSEFTRPGLPFGDDPSHPRRALVSVKYRFNAYDPLGFRELTMEVDLNSFGRPGVAHLVWNAYEGGSVKEDVVVGDGTLLERALNRLLYEYTNLRNIY